MPIMISIASGKGGVGKSVIAANLSLFLAKKGKQVVLADLDVGGADAHALVGLFHPPVTLTEVLKKRIVRLDEAAQSVAIHPNLKLIAGTGDPLVTVNMPYARKKRLIRSFQDLQADVVVIDIGAGPGFQALDFFLMADIHLAVATPDPTSVLDLYRFIKLAAIRRVLSHFLARDPMTEALSERNFNSVQEVLDTAGRNDEAGRASAEAALSTFRPGLIINRTVRHTHVNILHLRKLLRDYVGGDMTLIGEIPDDQAMERAVRSYLPVAEAFPQSPAARALERITENLLPLLASQPVPTPIPQVV
ncbi:MAG: P-loop NTPase [Nitrospiraceae bacterium]